MTQADPRALLGAFVRARRESLSPEAPATPPARRRRTPGLRREDLAARAGIGTTWVTWIEQGRATRPSAETLARLAAALCLTPPERAYMFTLAGRADPANPFAALPDDGAPPAIAAVAGALGWPAYGLDAAWNLCGANAAARRLFVGLFEEGDAPNLLRYAFTHPAARSLLPDWEARALRLLAEFRRDYGRALADPRAQAVVEWLKAHSPLFREGWERQAVMGREGGARHFLHPQDGPLHFTQHTLAAAERGDFRLVVLQPG